MEQLDLAILIAKEYHAGQVDKLGEPYIHHCRRVAARMDTTHDKMVAWLHDAVEDTPLTLQDLRDSHIIPSVVEAVDAMTKRPGESRTAYRKRVKANPSALNVKIQGDIPDNTDVRRLLRLPLVDAVRLMKKYADDLEDLES